MTFHFDCKFRLRLFCFLSALLVVGTLAGCTSTELAQESSASLKTVRVAASQETVKPQDKIAAAPVVACNC